MSCRESRPLLPLFVDGELDARQMRQVALHSTRCGDCESELRHLELLQDLVASHVTSEVEGIDLSGVWAGVAPRLSAVSRPWYRRLIESVGDVALPWRTLVPVSAAAAAAGLLAVLLWQSQQHVTTPSQVASAQDNSVIVEAFKTEADWVEFLRDSDTDTTVFWVSDSGGRP